MAGSEWPETVALNPTVAKVGVVKKVPGEVRPLGSFKHENRSDLSTKSIAELKHLLNVQKDLVANSSLMAKLPDRGVKAKAKISQLEELIRERTENMKEATNLMAALQLQKLDPDEMEWKYGGSQALRNLMPATTDQLDSDDDEDPLAEEHCNNPLKLLASRDLPPAKKVNPAEHREDAHVTHLCAKVDGKATMARFAPFRSLAIQRTQTRSVKPLPALQKNDKSDRPIRDRLVEVMPLPSDKYDSLQTQMLSLHESLVLHQRHLQSMAQLQNEQAELRLSRQNHPDQQRPQTHMSGEALMAYRSAPSLHSDDDDDDDDGDEEEQEDDAEE